MRILMPVTENNTSGRSVARGFHNAELVCLYDSGNESFEWISTEEFCLNPGELSKEFQKIGVDAIISYQMPLMALGFFAENGFAVYNTDTTNIDECIQLFASNSLKSMTNEICKSTSSCSSSCSSCSSTSCSSTSCQS